jgi:hypothetical protein
MKDGKWAQHIRVLICTIAVLVFTLWIALLQIDYWVKEEPWRGHMVNRVAI